jgi:hypothetical protein
VELPQALYRRSGMWRSAALGIVLAGLLAGCGVFGGGSRDTLMFTAQRTTVRNGDQPRHWKTVGTRTIRCNGAHPATGDHTTLLRDPCAAVAFLAGLHENLACFPSGSVIGPTGTMFRVLVDGVVNDTNVEVMVAGSCNLNQEAIHSRLYDARRAVTRTADFNERR